MNEVERLEKALADEIEQSGELAAIVHLKAFAAGREKGREEALLRAKGLWDEYCTGKSTASTKEQS